MGLVGTLVSKNHLQRRESFHQNSLRHQRPKLEPQEIQNVEQNSGPRRPSIAGSMAGSTIRRTSVSASTAPSNGISGLTDISSILKVKKAEKEAEEAEKLNGLNGGFSNGGHHQGPRRTSVAFSDVQGGQKSRQTPMSEQRGPPRSSQARNSQSRNSQARASMKGPRDSMSNG